MGQGGGITATFAIDGTGTPPWAFQSKSLSWYGSGGGYSMSNHRSNTFASLQSSIPTKTVSGGSGGLFPFASLNPTSYTNNYQLWAGTCRQEQPPAGTDTASVTPGYSGSLQVMQPAVDVFVTYTNKSGVTSAVTPAHVKLIFNSTSGNTCSDTWGAYTANASNQGSGSQLNYIFGAPFASSAISGSTASGSGQTGTVTVCADYKAAGIGNVKTNSAPFTDSFGSTTSATVAIPYSSVATGTC
jgi:hypothetical protein